MVEKSHDYDLVDAVLVPPSLNSRQARQVSDFPPHVQIPRPWLERLTGAKHVSTWKLAAFICYRKKLKGETEIVVSLVATKPWGLSKRSRRAAITELVRLGIVRVVDNGARQAPRVISATA